LPLDSAEPPAPADPDAAPDDASDAQSQPQAETPGDTAMPIGYDVRTNTIVLGKGAPSTLPAVSRALGRPDLLRELAPGEWLLAANLRIGKDVSLRIVEKAKRHRLEKRFSSCCQGGIIVQ